RILALAILVTLSLSAWPVQAGYRGGWSVGVSIGAPGPVYYRPWPYYYYRPYPVYVAPPPVIIQPAPVVQPVPVIQPAPVVQPGPDATPRAIAPGAHPGARACRARRPTGRCGPPFTTPGRPQ